MNCVACHTGNMHDSQFSGNSLEARQADGGDVNNNMNTMESRVLAGFVQLAQPTS